MTDTHEPADAGELSTTSTADDQRKPRVAIAAIAAVMLAGVVGIAVVARTAEPDLPKLRVGAPAAASAMSSSEMRMGPTEYVLAPGVVAPADEGPAFEMRGDLERGRMETLRDAFGMTGEFSRTGEWWQVENGNRVLRVEDGPTRPWAYYESGDQARCGPDRPVSSGHGAAGSPVCEPGWAPHPSGVSSGSAGGSSPGSAGGGTVEPSQPDCPMPPCPEGHACIQACPRPDQPAPRPRPAGMPSQAEAERVAREVLTRAGFELGGAEVFDGFDVWDVNIEPVLGGVPVLGMPQSVAVGPDGQVVRAMGQLLPAERLGTYPLASLERVIERLQEGGPGVDTMVLEAVGGPEAVSPPAPQPRTVVSVRLVLSQLPSYELVRSVVTLAPHFELTMGPRDTVAALAVTDEHIEAVPAPSPEPHPLPEPYPMPEPMPAETRPEPQPAPAP